MAAVTASNPSVDTVTAQKATHVSDLIAGEALAPCVACLVQSDGTVVASNGAAANLAAAIHGITARAAQAGEPVTLIGAGVRFQWTDAASLTPGAAYYLASGGGIDDASTLGDSTGAFFAASTTDLVLVGLRTVGA